MMRHAKRVVNCKKNLISWLNRARAEKVGIEWLLLQSKELKKAGVPVLHYYTLGRPLVVANVVENL